MVCKVGEHVRNLQQLGPRCRDVLAVHEVRVPLFQTPLACNDLPHDALARLPHTVDTSSGGCSSGLQHLGESVDEYRAQQARSLGDGGGGGRGRDDTNNKNAQLATGGRTYMTGS